MKRRKGLFVAAFLTGIFLMSFSCVTLARRGEEKSAAENGASVSEDSANSADGAAENPADDGVLRIVTSFYPMYIAAMNVTDGAEGIDLQNLSEPETGCLHDYQLTPGDMVLLSTADVFIVNGGGIEEFLTEVASAYPNITIIDAGEGIEALPEDANEDGEEHHHEDDAEEAHDHDHEDSDEDADGSEHEHEHDEEENAHFWMSVPRYRQQVQTIATGLIAADQNTENKKRYEENAAAYDSALAALEDTEAELRAALRGEEVILFHAAYTYLADDLSLTTAYLLDLDEEREISAHEVADVIEEIEEHDVHVILAEEEYGRAMGDRVAAETGVTVLYLDPLVKAHGSYEKDAYLMRMEKNLKKLKAGI